MSISYRISIFVFLLCGALSLACFRTQPKVESDAKPVTHELFDKLLNKYVNAENGLVNYQGLVKDRPLLDQYLALLSGHHPNDAHWTKVEQQVYWMNAYNAFTLQVVLDHYPVESIKDVAGKIPFINSVWDLKFIEIEGHTYDLNNIEHNILRQQFDDPRVHFGLNCASYSCPPLLTEAFTVEKMDEQLDRAARAFLADDKRNIIQSKDAIQLSKIFSWYKGDFTKEGTLIDYLNQFAAIRLEEDAKIDFLDYNWSLNEDTK